VRRGGGTLLILPGIEAHFSTGKVKWQKERGITELNGIKSGYKLETLNHWQLKRFTVFQLNSILFQSYNKYVF
jgi:hypothetical protein